MFELTALEDRVYFPNGKCWKFYASDHYFLFDLFRYEVILLFSLKVKTMIMRCISLGFVFNLTVIEEVQWRDTTH